MLHYKLAVHESVTHPERKAMWFRHSSTKEDEGIPTYPWTSNTFVPDALEKLDGHPRGPIQVMDETGMHNRTSIESGDIANFVLKPTER